MALENAQKNMDENSIEAQPEKELTEEEQKLLNDFQNRRISAQQIIEQDNRKREEFEASLKGQTLPPKTSSSKTQQPATALPDSLQMPKEISKRYVEVNGKYYFNNNTDQLAFVDRGRKLSTALVNKTVSKNMVDVAEARDWKVLEVKGKPDFRREVWLEATSRGILTKGYKPNEKDYAELQKRFDEQERASTKTNKVNSPKEQAQQEKQREKQNELDSFETLVDHGKAPYQHKKENSMSYFATLEKDGQERTVWGVGISEALEKSGIRKGDRIRLEKGNSKPVTVEAKERDENGNITETKQIETHRNEWKATSVEQQQARDAHAEAIRTKSKRELVRDEPELQNEIVALHVSEKFAEQTPMTKEDKLRFMQQVRETIAKNTSRGHIQPEIKIQETRTVEQQNNNEKDKENRDER